MSKYEPLSNKLRPRTIEEFIGQSHLLSDGKIIRRMVDSNTLSSMILYGPPGAGKTSLAYALSGTYKLPIYSLNASNIKKSDITSVLNNSDETSIIFIDEIHRLNKANQDLLLPDTESGRVILIGATTENPYLEVNKALRSRTQIFELKPLTKDELIVGLDRAVSYLEGELNKTITFDEDAKDRLIQLSNGDLRHVMNNIELAVKSNDNDKTDKIIVDLDTVNEIIGGNVISYDKDGDSHYDTLSAFQKSIRGSDVDASLYYLGVLLKSGDLENYALMNNSHNFELYSNIANGLNDKRKGLDKMMKRVMNGEINRIYITYKDRLTRFGFNCFQSLCDHHGTEIIIIYDVGDKSMEKELAKDIISIIHSSSGKLYGMRRRVKKEY